MNKAALLAKKMEAMWKKELARRQTEHAAWVKVKATHRKEIQAVKQLIFQHMDAENTISLDDLERMAVEKGVEHELCLRIIADMIYTEEMYKSKPRMVRWIGKTGKADG